jgi:hypothetical protein
MALSMVIRRWCQQISSWRRAAATIRFSAPGIPAVTRVLGGKSGVAGLIESSPRIIEAGPGASSAVLCGGLHRVPGLRGRERAWLFRGSDLKKKSGFRRFGVLALACWRGR